MITPTQINNANPYDNTFADDPPPPPPFIHTNYGTTNKHKPQMQVFFFLRLILFILFGL